MKRYIGIDLGGTTMRVAIVLENDEKFVKSDHFICTSQTKQLEVSGIGHFFVTRAEI